VDVFVVGSPPLLPPNRLSDLGQTAAWLLNVQIKPWLSPKRQRFLEDAIRIYGVEQRAGELVYPIGATDDIGTGVLQLGQACVRVADLTYTRRSSLQVSFSTELEEVLGDAELPYEVDRELRGRFGKLIPVDFLVSGARRQSAVLGLSSGNASAAHGRAVEVFRRWYDLEIPKRTEQQITIYDDRFDVYREDDLRRLADLSHVLPFSDRPSVCALLAA